MGDEETDGRRTIGVIFVALLWIVQSAGRLLFAYLAVTQGSLLDVPASEMTLQIVNTMFILLGVVGFVAAFGLRLTRKWGFGDR